MKTVFIGMLQAPLPIPASSSLLSQNFLTYVQNYQVSPDFTTNCKNSNWNSSVVCLFFFTNENKLFPLHRKKVLLPKIQPHTSMWNDVSYIHLGKASMALEWTKGRTRCEHSLSSVIPITHHIPCSLTTPDVSLVPKYTTYFHALLRKPCPIPLSSSFDYVPNY